MTYCSRTEGKQTSTAVKTNQGRLHSICSRKGRPRGESQDKKEIGNAMQTYMFFDNRERIYLAHYTTSSPVCHTAFNADPVVVFPVQGDIARKLSFKSKSFERFSNNIKFVPIKGDRQK
jgi:hypothetical protein